MAKITIPNVEAQFASKQGLNNRFQQVEDELNNKVLYRDNPAGEPNQMKQDLDMNGNRLLNVAGFTLDGIQVTADNVTYDNTGTALTGSELQATTTELDTRATANANTGATNSSGIAALQAQITELEDLVDTLDLVTAAASGTTSSSNVDLAVRRKATAAASTILIPPADYDLGNDLGSSAFMLENVGTNLVDCVLGSSILNYGSV